jgi:hypothetical protein
LQKLLGDGIGGMTIGFERESSSERDSQHAFDPLSVGFE